MSSGIFQRVFIGFVAAVALAVSVSGCNVCEEGAQCGGDSEGGKASRSQTEQCLGYCDRLNICGASQASDLDQCVKACEARFERLPEETAALCACIPDSRCEDAVEGRCTDEGSASGSGGSSATGGSANASSGGSHATGGSNSTGGSSHAGTSAAGGTSAGSGSSSGGAAASAGTSCGGTAGDGSGMSSAGADVGAAGSGEPGTACTCDCQCPASELCVDGYCSTSG